MQDKKVDFQFCRVSGDVEAVSELLTKAPGLFKSSPKFVPRDDLASRASEAGIQAGDIYEDRTTGRRIELGDIKAGDTKLFPRRVLNSPSPSGRGIRSGIRLETLLENYKKM